MSILTSTSAVIDALGGAAAVARMFDVKGNAVQHWNYKKFPPHTYLAIIKALSSKGLMADPALWSFSEVNLPAAEARKAVDR